MIHKCAMTLFLIGKCLTFFGHIFIFAIIIPFFFFCNFRFKGKRKNILIFAKKNNWVLNVCNRHLYNIKDALVLSC